MFFAGGASAVRAGLLSVKKKRFQEGINEARRSINQRCQRAEQVFLIAEKELVTSMFLQKISPALGSGDASDPPPPAHKGMPLQAMSYLVST